MYVLTRAATAARLATCYRNSPIQNISAGRDRAHSHSSSLCAFVPRARARAGGNDGFHSLIESAISSTAVAKTSAFCSRLRRMIVAHASTCFFLSGRRTVSIRGLTTSGHHHVGHLSSSSSRSHRGTPGRANLRRITDTISSERREASGVPATARPLFFFFFSDHRADIARIQNALRRFL